MDSDEDGTLGRDEFMEVVKEIFGKYVAEKLFAPGRRPRRPLVQGEDRGGPGEGRRRQFVKTAGSLFQNDSQKS
jgi:hypothetical protein